MFSELLGVQMGRDREAKKAGNEHSLGLPLTDLCIACGDSWSHSRNARSHELISGFGDKLEQLNPESVALCDAGWEFRGFH